MLESLRLHHLLHTTNTYAQNQPQSIAATQNLWDQPIFNTAYTDWLKTPIPQTNHTIDQSLNSFYTSRRYHELTTPPASTAWSHIIHTPDSITIFRQLIHAVARLTPHEWWQPRTSDWQDRPFFLADQTEVPKLVRRLVAASYGSVNDISPYNIINALSTKTYPPDTTTLIETRPLHNDELGTKLALATIAALDTHMPWGPRYICGNDNRYLPVRAFNQHLRPYNFEGNPNFLVTPPPFTYAGWYTAQIINRQSAQLKQQLQDLEARQIAQSAAGLATQPTRRSTASDITNYWQQRRQIKDTDNT